jgi:hydrogenase maturation protein HypF
MDVHDLIEAIQLKNDPVRVRLVVRGRVQGVGFRPSIYRFAERAGLGGWIGNTRAGAIIEVEGRADSIRAFLRDLSADLPPLARIDGIDAREIDPVGEREFRIIPSEAPGFPETSFPVDAATCADCLAEMRDPADKRYRYPFINCTNCGPRFTIIEGLPYDRPLTTMKAFEMDDFCRRQYTDPRDRRFHAEPISCPDCGPALSLIDAEGKKLPGDAIGRATELLAEGLIVAVKGLGGYHLACGADDEGIVMRLRERKKRPAKPFACMFRDMAAIERYCVVDETERRLLLSPEAPIVLLRRGGGAQLADAVAPKNGYIGAFLPYTPIHHLLMERFEALIMTSANLTDEPLISTEEELARVCGPIADAALVHNRRIAHKCDDSIFFVPAGEIVPIRRARGFVPEPFVIARAVRVEQPAASRMPRPEVSLGVAPKAATTRAAAAHVPPILALGAQEKSTFALSKDERIYVSPHLGDLGELRSQENYVLELASFERLLGINPEVCVCDMHPDYFTSRLARRLDVERIIEVQHHHAHAAGVMAEHGLDEPAIAAAFDGTGYGTDGKLWGGEFLLARYTDFERLATLTPVPLPGGEAAIREPWRMALVYLWNVFGEKALEIGVPAVPPRNSSGPHRSSQHISAPPTMGRRRLFEGLPAREVLGLARRGINAPLASSMGRLFDAVAFILGCGARVSYEAEAAVALEALALEAGDKSWSYSFGQKSGAPIEIDPGPVLAAIINDLEEKREPADIAAAFHRAVADLVIDLASRLSKTHSCRNLVISGGVFQNRFLCESLMKRAASSPLRVYQHTLVPPNDGGVSFGQLVVASARISKGKDYSDGSKKGRSDPPRPWRRRDPHEGARFRYRGAARGRGERAGAAPGQRDDFGREGPDGVYDRFVRRKSALLPRRGHRTAFRVRDGERPRDGGGEAVVVIAVFHHRRRAPHGRLRADPRLDRCGGARGGGGGRNGGHEGCRTRQSGRAFHHDIRHRRDPAGGRGVLRARPAWGCRACERRDR